MITLQEIRERLDEAVILLNKRQLKDGIALVMRSRHDLDEITFTHACDGCGIDIETDELRCDICQRYSKPAAPTKQVVKIHEMVMPDIPEYSTSMPTGTYAGKRWKRRTTDGWTLGEYIDDGADDGTLLIRWTPIEVIPRKPTVPFPVVSRPYSKEVKQ